MRKSVHSLDIEFNDNNILSSLFGINDVNIRSLWTINSFCLIYSRKNKTWFNGEIIDIFIVVVR